MHGNKFVFIISLFNLEVSTIDDSFTVVVNYRKGE